MDFFRRKPVSAATSTRGFNERWMLACGAHSQGDAECARMRGMFEDRSRWVHLRLCRICGHVGCCDSSPHRHATRHFHKTGHPIIEGYDPPEGWGWCYVDELFFDLSGNMTPHNGPIPRYV